MGIRVGVGAGLAWVGLAPHALLACTCVVSSASGGSPLPPPPALIDRPVVLVATALWEDSGSEYDGPGRQRVKLLPEASWKGPSPDTLTLTVVSPCAVYVAGGRYLIAAEIGGEGIISDNCGTALPLAEPTTLESLTELGPPTWIATASDDQSAVGLVGPDESPRASPESIRVSLAGFPPGVSHVEMAGDRWSPGVVERHGLRLPPGIYVGRVHWSAGFVTQFYLGVRCEGRDSRCFSLRFLGGLDIPLVLGAG